MSVQELFGPIRGDLEAVEKILLQKGTDSAVLLISRVGGHALSSGGKRFRPALTLLSGKLCGAPPDKRIPLAASMELIHTATLLHDDIVDEAAVRRGKPAAHRLWGDPAGVLTANFHFSRAFSMILRAGGQVCLQAVNRTIHAIVEGELMQFLRLGSTGMNEEDYREIITRKTARLLATACELGALAGEEKGLGDPLHRFGLELGMAFQMVDDLLDYTAQEKILGKTVGTDFREGKFTLPLIFSLSSCSSGERERLLELLREEPEIREAHFPWAFAVMEKSGGFAYTHREAGRHLDRALGTLNSLPPGPERQHLADLARFVVSRRN